METDWEAEAERLRAALVRVEALARAADWAAGAMPHVQDAEQRTNVGRLVELVGATAEAASAALTEPVATR